MIDMIISAMKILFRQKGRTLLTLFGIVIGTASVIMINHISQCGSDALTDEVDTLGMGGLSITQSSSSAPLTEKELAAIQKLSYVDFAMPLMFESTNVTVHDTHTPVFLWGIDKNAKDVINISLVSGRFLNAGDISSFARNCMVDQTLAESCFGTDHVTGRKLLIRNGGSVFEYTIVGVIKTGSGILQTMMGSFIPNFVYLPYTTMQNNAGSSNYSQIEVKLTDNYDHDLAGKDILHMMDRSIGAKGAYTVTNLARQKEGIRNMIRIFTVVLSCVGVISLLVAGLNIMNMMLASVVERRREIGIKKALGAGRGHIIGEFLAEAIVLTLLGCLIGMVTGTALSYLGAFLFGMTLIPDPLVYVNILLLSLLIGILFGIYPAWRAARLHPVQSLRLA